MAGELLSVEGPTRTAVLFFLAADQHAKAKFSCAGSLCETELSVIAAQTYYSAMTFRSPRADLTLFFFSLRLLPSIPDSRRRKQRKGTLYRRKKKSSRRTGGSG